MSGTGFSFVASARRCKRFWPRTLTTRKRLALRMLNSRSARILHLPRLQLTPHRRHRFHSRARRPRPRSHHLRNLKKKFLCKAYLWRLNLTKMLLWGAEVLPAAPGSQANRRAHLVVLAPAVPGSQKPAHPATSAPAAPGSQELTKPPTSRAVPAAPGAQKLSLAWFPMFHTRGVSLLMYLRSPRRRHRRGRSLMFFEVRLPRRLNSRTSRQPRAGWGLPSPSRRKVVGCFALPPFRPNLPHLKWLLREEVLNQNLNKAKKNPLPHPDVLLLWKRTPQRHGARPNPLPRVSAPSWCKPFVNSWPKTLPRKRAIRNRGVLRLAMSAAPGSQAKSRVPAVSGSQARSRRWRPQGRRRRGSRRQGFG